MSKKFSLPDELVLLRDASWLNRIWLQPYLMLWPLMTSLLVPPAVYKSTFKNFNVGDLIKQHNLLGQSIGFSDQQSQEAITFHARRNALYQIMSTILGAVFSPLVIIYSFTIVISLTNINFISFLLIFLISFVLYLTLIRVVFIFVSSNFAESLCIISCIELLVELEIGDLSADFRQRRIMIRRINQLAKHTALLSIKYRSQHMENRSWIKSRFTQIKQFIVEREKSIVIPTKKTSIELRKDFQYLAKIYISGSYGEFDKHVDQVVEESLELTISQRILNILTRGLGVFIPLGIMTYLLLQPSLMENFGIDPNVLSLILLAWLLLAIDNFFKLGIVSSVVGLAREIRDLRS